MPVGAPDFYYTAPIMFSTMAHYALVAAERRMYSFGFGVDNNPTRLQLLRGFESIGPTDPTTGLLQSVGYFENGATARSLRLAALTQDGKRYQPVAILGSADTLAVIDPTVLSDLAVPQQADYDALDPTNDDAGQGASPALLALLVLPVALVLGLFLLSRRRQRRKAADRASLAAAQLVLLAAAHLQPLQAIARQRLTVVHKWGLGSFSRVLLCVLDRETPVVLKQWQRLEKAPSEAWTTATAHLRSEWQIVADLGYIPQVLHVFGFVAQGERLTGVVVECCDGGDMHSFLLREPVPVPMLCQLAADVAAGMAAIVATGAVRYDLSARRIYVLDNGRRCKVAHVGMSKEGDRGRGRKDAVTVLLFFLIQVYHHFMCHTLKHAFGCLVFGALRRAATDLRRAGQSPTHLSAFTVCIHRWCAPEVLKGELPTAASNVWSFGVVLYEMLSRGALPFDGLSTVQVKMAVLAGSHVSLPEGCPEQLRYVAQSCFDFEPAKRANFAWLSAELARLVHLTEEDAQRRLKAQEDVCDRMALSRLDYGDNAGVDRRALQLRRPIGSGALLPAKALPVAATTSAATSAGIPQDEKKKERHSVQFQVDTAARLAPNRTFRRRPLSAGSLVAMDVSVPRLSASTNVALNKLPAKRAPASSLSATVVTLRARGVMTETHV